MDVLLIKAERATAPPLECIMGSIRNSKFFYMA